MIRQLTHTCNTDPNSIFFFLFRRLMFGDGGWGGWGQGMFKCYTPLAYSLFL